MDKTLTLEITTDDAAAIEAALESCVTEMRHANERMRQDQEEIDRLKKEAQASAAQTRAALAQLEAA